MDTSFLQLPSHYVLQHYLDVLFINFSFVQKGDNRNNMASVAVGDPLESVIVSVRNQDSTSKKVTLGLT